MSNALTRLLKAAETDDALRAELLAATEPSDVVRIAEGHGITLSEADLDEEREIGDAELQGTAGGTGFTWVYCQTVTCHVTVG